MKYTKLSKADFDSFYTELKKGFIPDEYRSYDDALSLFKNDEYEIFCLENGGVCVGFMSIWQLSDFAFIEHVVIKEEYRNRGLGEAALTVLKSRFKKIVLEAEPAVQDIQKRRLNFYKRNGFVENDGDYMQPAYNKNTNEVKLVIMSYPEKIDDFDSAVLSIRRKVYQKA